MAGDLSHERETGASRGIVSRWQFGCRHHVHGSPSCRHAHGESRVGQIVPVPEAQNDVRWPMPHRFVFALRSVAAVVGGYLIVAAGTILTFNVLVGQVTVQSNPRQMILGTIGAVLAGIAGGVAAGIVAPRFPFGHAAAVLLFLALDTASVLAKGTGPAWFDLTGSVILAISVLLGGWIIAETARRRTGDGSSCSLSALRPDGAD
jgi:hypothetical protein